MLFLSLAGFGELRLISDDDIPTLLKENFKAQFSSLDDTTVSHDDPWIRQVWKHLQGKHLEKFDHLPLLPCPRDGGLQLRPLRGNYVCERLEGFPPAPPALGAALADLGVHMVASLPDFVLQHGQVVHSRVQPASCQGVLTSLATLAGEEVGTLDQAVCRFNTESKADDRFALVEILAAGLSRGGRDGEETEQEEEWSAAKSVLRRLELFPVWPGRMDKTWGHMPGKGKGENSDDGHYDPSELTSVQNNCHMTPDVSSRALLPPSVACSPKLIDCVSKAHRLFASDLGANEMTLVELVEKILGRLSRDDAANSDLENYNNDVITFMKYFLESPAFQEETLKTLARRMRSVPTSSRGELRRAEELYNPENRLLQDLFAGEHSRFPCGSFYRSGTSILQNLKEIGLRDAANVTAPDLTRTASEIGEYCRSSKPEDSSLAKRKAKALWELLMEHGRNFPQDVIQQLANLQCLPCVTTKEVAPADYPAAVPVCPAEYTALGIARPGDMCDHSELRLVGSVKPVSLHTAGQCSIRPLFHQPTSGDIIGHLEIVTSTLMKTQTHHVASILHHIYGNLKQKCEEGDETAKEQLKDMKCILTEKDGHFRRPCEFWVQETDSDDLDLSPYRFPLPSTLADEGLSEFFVACGCSQRQDSDTLRNVLQEIQRKHTESRHNEKDCKRDFSLAQRILKAIVEMGEPEEGEVLLPVYTSEKDVLQLALARECTLAPDSDVIELLIDEEAMTFVHPDVDKDIALKLGALDLRSRTLTGVDDLEMDDSAFGQYEQLTTRLRHLLQDGYTDGFSIPKVGFVFSRVSSCKEVRTV